MPEWLNNEWVVGIGGGILSGLAVSIISRLIFSRKDEKEYLQNVRGANAEVVYALRPLISESAFPSRAALHSLLNATARKFKVQVTDIYSIPQVIDELIKDVMDSSFVPHKQKSIFCDSLLALKNAESQQNQGGPRELDPKYKLAVDAYRNNMLNLMSATLGITVTLFTLFFSLRETFTFDAIEIQFLTFIAPVFAAILASAFMMSIVKPLGRSRLLKILSDLLP